MIMMTHAARHLPSVRDVPRSRISVDCSSCAVMSATAVGLCQETYARTGTLHPSLLTLSMILSVGMM